MSRNRILTDRVIQQLDKAKNATSTRGGIAADERGGTNDVTTLGGSLAMKGVAWLQNTAYVVGDIRIPPADTTVANGGGNTFKCIIAGTSTNSGTAVEDWATDLAAGKWEAITIAPHTANPTVAQVGPLTDAVVDMLDSILIPDPNT